MIFTDNHSLVDEFEARGIFHVKLLSNEEPEDFDTVILTISTHKDHSDICFSFPDYYHWEGKEMNFIFFDPVRKSFIVEYVLNSPYGDCIGFETKSIRKVAKEFSMKDNENMNPCREVILDKGHSGYDHQYNAWENNPLKGKMLEENDDSAFQELFALNKMMGN